MHIAILGPGRLGRTLDHLLREAGWTVELAGRADPVPDAPIALLTVPDAAIAEVATRVPSGRIVLHCSGAADVSVLRPHSPAGSFHPLMTFPGPEVAIPPLRGVPAALAGDPRAVEAGRRIADALGMSPLEVPGDRALYHCAAVMAGNFATVLLAEASRVLVAAGVDPEQAAPALVPLAMASLQNVGPDPARSLTGPAARGDRATIRTHLSALDRANLADQRAVYEALNRAALRIVGQQPMDSEPEQD